MRYLGYSTELLRLPWILGLAWPGYYTRLVEIVGGASRVGRKRADHRQNVSL